MLKVTRKLVTFYSMGDIGFTLFVVVFVFIYLITQYNRYSIALVCTIFLSFIGTLFAILLFLAVKYTGNTLRGCHMWLIQALATSVCQSALLIYLIVKIATISENYLNMDDELHESINKSHTVPHEDRKYKTFALNMMITFNLLLMLYHGAGMYFTWEMYKTLNGENMKMMATSSMVNTNMETETEHTVTATETEGEEANRPGLDHADLEAFIAGFHGGDDTLAHKKKRKSSMRGRRKSKRKSKVVPVPGQDVPLDVGQKQAGDHGMGVEFTDTTDDQMNHEGSQLGFEQKRAKRRSTKKSRKSKMGHKQSSVGTTESQKPNGPTPPLGAAGPPPKSKRKSSMAKSKRKSKMKKGGPQPQPSESVTEVTTATETEATATDTAAEGGDG